MFESDVIDTATNGHIDSELLANGAEPSSAYPPAAVLSGPMPEQLEEINQLITDLEQATQAKHASVTMLRGKLAVSQQQLDAKAAELEDLREEAERSLEQLQSTQAQLEEQVFNLKEAREENASANLQLHQVDRKSVV